MLSELNMQPIACSLEEKKLIILSSQKLIPPCTPIQINYYKYKCVLILAIPTNCSIRKLISKLFEK